MLFVESQTLSHEVERAKRLELFEELQKNNLTPPFDKRDSTVCNAC